MRKWISKTSLAFPLVSLCLLLILGSCGKADFRKAQVDEFSLSSGFTGRNYLIRVLLPPDYSPDQTYPMVTLLDGYFHFDELGEDLVPLMQDGEIKDVIVAGIFYEDYPFEGKTGNLDNLGTIYETRESDLLFPMDTTDEGRIIGGDGNLFYQFITEELAPVLESSYNTDTTQRTLMGHSYAGYFTLFHLFDKADQPFFPRLAALSTAFPYANGNLFSMEADANGIVLPYDLYLGVGSLEGTYFNATYDQFVAQLEASQHAGLTWDAGRYTGSHTFSAKDGFINAIQYFYE